MHNAKALLSSRLRLGGRVVTSSGLIAYKDFCRYLTTRELEIGQTLPVGYTKGLSKNEAEDVIGDAWTADMIAHFFGYLKRDMEKKQEETK